jgi:hypothetical protein
MIAGGLVLTLALVPRSRKLAADHIELAPDR